jgi:ABC-type multidrug transport system ATPase subunit
MRALARLLKAHREAGLAAAPRPFSFEGVTYENERGARELNAVSGALHPGEMVALLGQPGSGCSPLLEALSGRLSGARVTGHVGMADKAYALSRHNSELNASVALIA